MRRIPGSLLQLHARKVTKYFFQEPTREVDGKRERNCKSKSSLYCSMFRINLSSLRETIILARGRKEGKQWSDHQPDRQDQLDGELPRLRASDVWSHPDSGQEEECQHQAAEVGRTTLRTPVPPSEGDI